MLFQRFISFLLAIVVFISSTGFVSVQRVCNMTGKEIIVKNNCACSDDCSGQNLNAIKKASCCSVKANYFINAVASFNLKTSKTFFYLPIIKTHSNFISLLSNLSDEIGFSIVDKSPPIKFGRALLLQKSLLLI